MRVNVRAVQSPIQSPMRTLFFMRSYFPAPKFCPTKVVTAIPNALLTIQYKESIFPKALQAATVSVPRLFKNVWISMLVTLYKTDWMPVGQPTQIRLIRAALWNRIFRNSS